MTRSLFSPSWHSVAELRPRLNPQAKVSRHVYRGQVWYVVQDQTGGRHHRLSAPAYALLQGMDGVRSVQQLWERANFAGSGDDCTQSEVVELLVQLHAADLLQADASPDSAALFERHRQKRRASLKQFLLNPMSVKLPLYDPGAFLNRWAPSLAWCFGPLGLFCWLLVVLPAAILAVQHWQALTHDVSGQLLAPDNLLIAFLVFPVVKLLHELGHGFATRVWGGAVHEMGVMFLVFAPVPYVEASAASSFPDKYRRAAVGAAGMMVELFLASIALGVWLLVEPGLIRAVAFNVMMIAGISTLLINGNPLLRYDGYFILCDLIEMPNMAQRGQRYLAYLWDRHVFGAHELDAPQEGRAEKRWLALYTPLAWGYRTFITISIIIFVAGEFFIFGVLIALWGLATLIGVPLWKAWRHVTRSPTLQRRRQPAMRIASGMVAVLLLVMFFLPAPLRTRAEGVVWLPDQALLRAGGNGFFVRWLVEPGTRVGKGTPVFVLEEALLSTELEVARARVAEAEARYRAEQFADPIKAQITGRQLEHEQSLLGTLEERAARLVGKAEMDGVLVAAQSQDLPGRYLKKGELVGHVLEKDNLLARVVVPQDDIDLVRQRLAAAELRFADRIARQHTVSLIRATAGGIDELPSAALGLPGGGTIPVLPTDQSGVKTLQRVFMVDLALPREAPPAAFGERVFVRFGHGWEPLAWQVLRRLRQLFLSHFGV